MPLTNNRRSRRPRQCVDGSGVVQRVSEARWVRVWVLAGVVDLNLIALRDGNRPIVARIGKSDADAGVVVARRRTPVEAQDLTYVDAPVPTNVWYLLRVEFAGGRIKVLLDGKVTIETQDSHITGSAAAGVWTKADSVTAFDDFRYASTTP